jgi:hypothetical protein
VTSREPDDLGVRGHEEGPVRPVQVRAARLLPLQDGELVAQIKISAVCHTSSRRDSRSHEATRAIRRNLNRRHMTGDHHSGMAGRATLLVRATDGILSTHRLGISIHTASNSGMLPIADRRRCQPPPQAAMSRRRVPGRM